jgi:hypothetical protein
MTLALDLAGLKNAPAARPAACASKTTMMIIITPTIGTGRTRVL